MDAPPIIKEPAPSPSLVSVRFDFKHKLFALPGASFRPNEAGELLFHADLGDLHCALTLPTLSIEFGIAPDSHDGRLLALIDRSLRYVKEIRPGDWIPREMLDGSCSWRVESRHHEIASQRLKVQLVQLMTGDQELASGSLKLEQIAEDPTIKKRVLAATAEAADRIGIGRERRVEILTRIETIARELAYIEALRERFGQVRAITEKLGTAAHLYRRDRAVYEEITRIQTLIRRPLDEFGNDFDLVDAQTGEIIALLRNMDSQIRFIRVIRDMIHYKLMAWDEVLPLWEVPKIERSDTLELVIRQTYHFVARKFPIEDTWKRTSKHTD